MYRPSAILWDGNQVWVCIEGVVSDVAAQASLFDFEEVTGPPSLPTAGRLTVEPKELRGHAQKPGERWIAEVGVGVIHTDSVAPHRTISDVNLSLMKDLEDRLDPNNRLNPGRQVLVR